MSQRKTAEESKYYSREQVIGLLNELLMRPDLLLDAVSNEQTDHNAESLLEDAETFLGITGAEFITDEEIAKAAKSRYGEMDHWGDTPFFTEGAKWAIERFIYSSKTHAKQELETRDELIKEMVEFLEVVKTETTSYVTLFAASELITKAHHLTRNKQ